MSVALYEGVHQRLLERLASTGPAGTLAHLLSGLSYVLQLSKQPPEPVEEGLERLARYVARAHRMHAYQRLQAAVTLALGLSAQVLMGLREEEDVGAVLLEMLEVEWDAANWAQQVFATRPGVLEEWARSVDNFLPVC